MEDFLKEDISSRFLNINNTYIQYTGQYQPEFNIYDSEKINQIYDILIDFDYLNYVSIVQNSIQKQNDYIVVQLKNSKLWIKLKNNEYAILNPIIPDDTNYYYTYFDKSVYLPSVIYINDVENLETDEIFITFALDQNNPKELKKQNKYMFKSLNNTKDDKNIKINKIQNLDESQEQLLQVLQKSQKIHLTVFNPPSFQTHFSMRQFNQSIFMQTLLKSKVYTINILMPQNLKPNSGVFALLAYFSGSSYKTGNLTALKLNQGNNYEQAKTMKNQKIAILSDNSYNEDPNNIFQYHAHLMTWISEQRNFFFKTISAVRDYYKYIEFKPPYISNFDLNKDIAKSPYFMYAYLEVKRSYKIFNLLLASQGSIKFYNNSIQKGKLLYDQYSQIIKQLPGEVNYYTITSRTNYQHQLFLTDTEIFATQGEYEKIMVKEYEDKQNFSSFMGYLVNNFCLFILIKNERKYVEKIKYAFLLNIAFIVINLCSNIGTVQMQTYVGKINWEVVLLFLIYAYSGYVAVIIVLNIFIFLLVFQVQEEHNQLQNQNTINSLNISQENFYLELMQDFKDQHLQYNIPEIPQIQEVKSLYNIQTSSYITSSQELGKQWISLNQLMIFFAQRGNVLTKDEIYQEIYKKNVKKGLSNSKTVILTLFFLFLVFLRFLGLTLFQIFDNPNNDFLFVGYTIVIIFVYFLLGYQILIVKFWVQRNKRRSIQRVLNMIKPRYMEEDIPDVYKNIGNEIPIINVACINSWTQWMNYYSLMQHLLRLDEPYFDINDTVNILGFLLYAVLIFLDLFGFAWKKKFLINNQYMMFQLLVDLFMLIFLICMNFYYKVKRNDSFIIFEKTIKQHLQYYKTFYANIDILFDEYKNMEKDNQQQNSNINVTSLDVKQELKRNKNLEVQNNTNQRRMSKMLNTQKNPDQPSLINVDSLLNDMVENKYVDNNDKIQDQQGAKQNIISRKQQQLQQLLAFENIICDYSKDKSYSTNDFQKFTSHSANIQKQYMIKLVREVCIDMNLKNKNNPEKYITLKQVELKDIKNHIIKLKEKLEFISEKLLIDKEKNQAKFLGLIVLDQKLLSSIIASAAIAIGGLIAEIVSSELQKQS